MSVRKFPPLYENFLACPEHESHNLTEKRLKDGIGCIVAFAEQRCCLEQKCDSCRCRSTFCNISPEIRQVGTQYTAATFFWPIFYTFLTQINPAGLSSPRKVRLDNVVEVFKVKEEISLKMISVRGFRRFKVKEKFHCIFASQESVCLHKFKWGTILC